MKMRMVSSSSARLAQGGAETGEIFIQIGDHAVEVGAAGVDLWARAIGRGVLRRHIEGGMRRVRRQVTEEGLAVAGHTGEESACLSKPDVGAIAGEAARLAVDGIHIVKIVVAPGVRRLPDAAAAMGYAFVETAITRAVGPGCRRGATCRRWRCGSRRRAGRRPASLLLRAARNVHRWYARRQYCWRSAR